MTTTSCANTESDEHGTATAAFDEAASNLEELGFVHEVTLDGVAFSRCSEPDAGEYGPETKIAAAPFLFSRAKRDSGTRLHGSSGRRGCLQGPQSQSPGPRMRLG
jgi:hypothetical protein